MLYVETGNRSRRDSFVANWVGGAQLSGTQRRRLMAALRIAHRVLGIKRDKLGLGTLGGAGSGTRALGTGLEAMDVDAHGGFGPFGGRLAAWASPVALAIGLMTIPPAAHAQTSLGGATTTSNGGIAIGGGNFCDT